MSCLWSSSTCPALLPGGGDHFDLPALSCTGISTLRACRLFDLSGIFLCLNIPVTISKYSKGFEFFVQTFVLVISDFSVVFVGPTDQSRNPSMAHQTCDYKLVLFGDTAGGKSCLVIRFVRNDFFEFQEPTIGGRPTLNCAIPYFLFSLHEINTCCIL